jgi:DUF1365 family protein
MNSYLYIGQVRHRRTSPRVHQFSYKLFMSYLDLDELPTLFNRYWLWSAERFNLAWFKRSDHLGDQAQPLSESVRDRVENETGHRPTGRVCLLTHLRYFGFGFNPVSFYYCYDKNEQLHSIIAEVSNTPWRERYEYVFPVNASHPIPVEDGYCFSNEKRFHVSPYMPMDIEYRWHVSRPEQALAVQIENLHAGEKMFEATLDLQRVVINSRSLRRILIQFPLITAKLVAAIYFEAIRLWIKKTPFYPHSSQSREEHQS